MGTDKFDRQPGLGSGPLPFPLRRKQLCTIIVSPHPLIASRSTIAAPRVNASAALAKSPAPPASSNQPKTTPRAAAEIGNILPRARRVAFPSILCLRRGDRLPLHVLNRVGAPPHAMECGQTSGTTEIHYECELTHTPNAIAEPIMLLGGSSIQPEVRK